MSKRSVYHSLVSAILSFVDVEVSRIEPYKSEDQCHERLIICDGAFKVNKDTIVAIEMQLKEDVNFHRRLQRIQAALVQQATAAADFSGKKTVLIVIGPLFKKLLNGASVMITKGELMFTKIHEGFGCVEGDRNCLCQKKCSKKPSIADNDLAGPSAKIQKLETATLNPIDVLGLEKDPPVFIQRKTDHICLVLQFDMCCNSNSQKVPENLKKIFQWLLLLKNPDYYLKHSNEFFDPLALKDLRESIDWNSFKGTIALNQYKLLQSWNKQQEQAYKEIQKDVERAADFILSLIERGIAVKTVESVSEFYKGFIEKRYPPNHEIRSELGEEVAIRMLCERCGIIYKE